MLSRRIDKGKEFNPNLLILFLSIFRNRDKYGTVDITPEMANMVIQSVKALNVECIVAPYEADAQLTHLYLTGKAQVVITEDSDLLPFGVKKCFFKMDRQGNGFEIDLDKLDEVTDYDFKVFKGEMLLTLCILSGCDYL